MTLSAAKAAALQEVQSAMTAARDAQQSGNFAQYGAALQRLEEAMGKFDAAKGPWGRVGSSRVTGGCCGPLLSMGGVVWVGWAVSGAGSVPGRRRIRVGRRSRCPSLILRPRRWPSPVSVRTSPVLSRTPMDDARRLLLAGKGFRRRR